MPPLGLVLEILWVETLQELLELLLVHIFTQLDGIRFVQDLFPNIDRSTCTECDRNGITWPGVYGDLLPFGLEVDQGVVDVFPDIHHRDLHNLCVKHSHDIANKIMRHGPMGIGIF